MDNNLTLLLDEGGVSKCFIEAVKEYQAWGALSCEEQRGFYDNAGNFVGTERTAVEVDESTEITVSEWGIIKVLAHLFCERENALIQESSRVASHEPYGRSSSEVEQDIHNFRNEYFRRLVFSTDVLTI